MLFLVHFVRNLFLFGLFLCFMFFIIKAAEFLENETFGKEVTIQKPLTLFKERWIERSKYNDNYVIKTSEGNLVFTRDFWLVPAGNYCATFEGREKQTLSVTQLSTEPC